MALKIAKNAVCPDCGADLPDASGYCLRCGRDTIHEVPAEDGHPAKVVYEDGDLPVRASYYFWFDRLLFTRLWYIPVGLLVIILSPMIELSIFHLNPEAIAVTSVFAAVVFFVCVVVVSWRRRREHRRFS